MNAYRRLDPHFEAPNQIKASATDRGSMVRVPIGNSRSMRVEVRVRGAGCQSLPDALLDFQDGHRRQHGEDRRTCARRSATCRTTSRQAIEDFKASSWIGKILGADVQGRFADLKQAAADRSPRELGTFVKGSEVQYHHEVYNQSLWNLF